MTTGKTIALTRWTFVGKGMSLLLNMLSRLVITFLPRHLLLAVLGLRCCMGFSLVVMLGLLIAVPFYCGAQLQGVQASSAAALRFWSTDRLSGHGARA